MVWRYCGQICAVANVITRPCFGITHIVSCVYWTVYHCVLCLLDSASLCLVFIGTCIIVSCVYWNVHHCVLCLLDRASFCLVFIGTCIIVSCVYWTVHRCVLCLLERASLCLVFIGPCIIVSCVYWTVHHCVSWRIRDQLDITSYYASSVLNMFRTLIHPSSIACDFSIVSQHWSCVLVSMCVGVSVWLGWSGICVAGWSLHPDTTPPSAKPQRNTNTHRTTAIQPMK